MKKNLYIILILVCLFCTSYQTIPSKNTKFLFIQLIYTLIFLGCLKSIEVESGGA